MTSPAPRDWLIACLRGASPPWPAGGGGEFAERLWQTAQEEGVSALLAHRFGLDGPPEGLPEAVALRFNSALKEAAGAEMLIQRELMVVLDTLAEAGIEHLLLKGAGLAYWLYPEPYLRSRCDTDLLVPARKSAERLWQLLQGRGYQRAVTVVGEWVSNELAYSRPGLLGVTHTLDVHWRLSNMQRFARVQGFAELAAEAVPLPGLGRHARGLGAVHSLLHAAMHRIGHLADGSANRLIWLWDLHLLAQSLDRGQWDQLLALAQGTGQCGVCRDGLHRAAECFGTALPEGLLAALERAAGMEGFHPRQVRTRLGVEVSNLKSLGSWSARLALVKEHLFPHPEYLLAKYQTSNRGWLPLLYLRRIWEGIPKLWR